MAIASWEELTNQKIAVLNETSLNSVTTATNGTIIDVRRADSVNVLYEVSSNTGAVTVSVQESDTEDFSGIVNTIDTETFTATNATRGIPYSSTRPYIRVITTTQSNSTVLAKLTARP